jgi:hypothetical protein
MDLWIEIRKFYRDVDRWLFLNKGQLFLFIKHKGQDLAPENNQ